MLSARPLLLAALPLILLLFVQQPSSSTQQLQTLLASWLPSSLHNAILLDRPRVAISQGTVVGTTLTDTLNHPVDAFRGIPYAVPPVGDRRFRRAVPVNASDELVDASRYGPRCPGKQLLQIPGDSGSSEDCLTVNVFRPQGVQGKLPVAVYVHGGAYNRGTASMASACALEASKANKKHAQLTHCRIGALGFLPSTTTANEGILNLGLHDQLLLFQWVQDNIASFGGDPSQVTLIGLSAGAHSIAHHILNPDLQHTYFHRAIIESGAATSRAVHAHNAALHEAQFREFVTAAGCAHTLSLPDPNILTCLRAAPSTTITTASSTVFDRYNPSVRWAFQPVIDGDLIKRRPIDAWRAGAWNKNIALLTGFNTNEGTYYVPTALATAAEFSAFFAALLPAWTAQDLRAIDALYPDPAVDGASPYLETRNISVGPQFKRVEAAYGHYAYACPVRQTARFVSAAQQQREPVFLYRWALNRTVLGGANHGDQMAYETFDPEVRAFSPAQEEMAGTFHAYITSFIVSGDPNAVRGRFARRPRWEPFDASQRIMVLGEGNDERAGGRGVGVTAQMADDEWSSKECDFWWTKSGVSD
ncbi:putative extracellular lipase [Aspergillus aculeatinus CBS 121060]|uniref:Extracellular lipase n=1 Tax=Aspergillus aculeatinus CBS 121060 TaxID=1448322 RepID=A0ACD1H9E0_9EURO|nr:putative extracellular lipase [Aspergillus aculeatinus CBS 121060]RAH70187.1 putative extracellular lipase [Aspergillus aculeatinus CBS 121060]